MAIGARSGICGLFTPLIAAGLLASLASACPFCNPNLTLTERINEAHCCYAVEWVSGAAGNADRGETGTTDVRVTHVFKNGEPLRQVGEIITLPDFSQGQPGEKSLLFGKLRIEEQRGGTATDAAGSPADEAVIQEVEKLGWDGLVPVTDEVLTYVANRPPFEVKAPERLPYFLPFLEHPNETIAVDAYSEFGNAPYEAVKAVAARLPRAQMVRWVSQPDASTGRIARIGFYGLALGLCGGPEEAAALEAVIRQPTSDFRLGIDGIMAGYLLLSGRPGLDVLKQHALAPGMPASEIYALLQAVKFHWEFGDGRISRDDMRATLRPFVEHPQFADLVIIDLTRWEDLTLVDRLIELYSQAGFDNLETQTAIARYYLAMAALDPAARSPSDAAAIARAQGHLAALRSRDGELVDRAERLFRAPEPAPAQAGSPVAAPPTLAVQSASAESDAAGLHPRWILWGTAFLIAAVLILRPRVQRTTPTGGQS